VVVVVADDGHVDVTLDVTLSSTNAQDAPAADLAEKVRLIVRAVTKQARADEVAPPLRIVRWRGEK
jgi:hypothetical protein